MIMCKPFYFLGQIIFLVFQLLGFFIFSPLTFFLSDLHARSIFFPLVLLTEDLTFHMEKKYMSRVKFMDI